MEKIGIGYDCQVLRPQLKVGSPLDLMVVTTPHRAAKIPGGGNDWIADGLRACSSIAEAIGNSTCKLIASRGGMAQSKRVGGAPPAVMVAL